MKKILAVMIMGTLFSLTGCAGLMVLATGRGMTLAHNGYYKHSTQGVSLFKVKSPAGIWRTNKSIWGQRNGSDESLSFGRDGKDNVPGSFPDLYAHFYFNIDDEREKLVEKIEFLSGNENYLASSIENELKKMNVELKYIGEYPLKGIKCVRIKYLDEDIPYHGGVSMIIRVQCPGFFRHTLGAIIVSVAVNDIGYKSGKPIDELVKEVEPDIQRSLDSFKLIEPFSQKVPPGFSLNEQLKRTAQGEGPNSYRKFKL